MIVYDNYNDILKKCQQIDTLTIGSEGSYR